ncbi:hypothetical protein HY384_03435 [Candidatus Daviesbacteria bacterium]|nr:hypothetical protein [Candidatus Daviesbacteria bacterium]
MKNLQNKLIFFLLFTILGFIFLQIPFNKLAGSNVSFTLFDFFAPIAGAFLGPFYGIGSVLAVEVINTWFKHSPLTTGSMIRLFPVLFAVYYFATINNKKYQGRWILAVPIISIIAFLAHPIGRQVPYYPLMFWTIPLIAYRFRNNLFLKSLGTTFTAHSVGGAAWIWAFNLKTSIWQGLIPVVIAERLLFALGIAASYLVIKHTLDYLALKKILPRLEHAVS